MCLLTTMKKDMPSVYESLGTIDRSFEQIRHELERLQQFDWFRGRAPMKAVGLSVRETQASDDVRRSWTLLHEREERKWMRLGRIRNSQDERSPTSFS